MQLPAPLLSGRPPISGYGRGRFRLGGIEHAGSLLVLPEGVYDWPVSSAGGLSGDALQPVLSHDPPLDFLILGTGVAQLFPDKALRHLFAEAKIGLEAMDTGAAARTYNVLLAEERIFAAALIAAG
ncbi:MAG: Mth938-like domain-containing protein [Hyphomicrobiales bacterium]|nr:Mth938-like domain-containing protein [Hyphomicrobiales bacterium]